MSEFSLLNQSDLFGPSKFDIFEKELKCTITDFAILLGGYVSSIHFINDNYIKKNRTTWYWTQNTKNRLKPSVINEDGSYNEKYATKRDGGIRPVMNITDIPNFINDTEFEYGEYPQSIVEKYKEDILEEKYLNGTLFKTGKRYEVDSIDTKNGKIDYTPRKIDEYIHDGVKYIRINALEDINTRYLSDGRQINKNHYYWVKVEPIKWIYDKKKNKAITKEVLISGIQYNNSLLYKDNFEDSNIGKYLNNVFKKNIIPSQVDYTNIASISKKKKNPYYFNFNNVSEEDIIRGAIESNVAVFLHGKSSEGKSARVKQIDPNCEIIYLRNATPDSLNGKSVYNAQTGEMIDIAPTWYKKLKKKCEDEPNKIHLLFFDEISNALPSIQGMAFNIILDKEINGIWKLPENARIVAAGNDINDSLAANNIAEPLFNRFAHVYINTTVDSWLLWASTPKQSYEKLDYKKEESMPKIHPAIYAYIAYKGQDVLRTPYNGVTPNADPRKWEMASKVLYQTKSPEMLRSLVGEEITKDFSAFCKQQVITIEDVINGNYTDNDLEMNISEKFATAAVLSAVDENNLVTIRQFIKLLGMEILAIFDTLWIHGDESRLEKIAEIKLGEQFRYCKSLKKQ